MVEALFGSFLILGIYGAPYFIGRIFTREAEDLFAIVTLSIIPATLFLGFLAKLGV